MKATVSLRKIRRVFFFLALIFTSFAQAQTVRKPDIITLRDANKLEVLIQEVDDHVIKYKKISDPEGPLFTVKKTDIASIQYGNGETETFEAVLEVPGYYVPGASKSQVPRSSAAAMSPKARFQEELQAASPDKLRAIYKFYKSRSKSGIIMGIVGTAGGTILAGIGTGILASATSPNGGYNSYRDERRAVTGACMMLGGFAGGATFGTIGFVKGGRNGSKATRVRRELVRRHEPIAFHLSPGFNPANRAGFLTLSAKF